MASKNVHQIQIGSDVGFALRFYKEQYKVSYSKLLREMIRELQNDGILDPLPRHITLRNDAEIKVISDYPKDDKEVNE